MDNSNTDRRGRRVHGGRRVYTAVAVHTAADVYRAAAVYMAAAVHTAADCCTEAVCVRIITFLCCYEIIHAILAILGNGQLFYKDTVHRIGGGEYEPRRRILVRGPGRHGAEAQLAHLRGVALSMLHATRLLPS